MSNAPERWLLPTGRIHLRKPKARQFYCKVLWGGPHDELVVGEAHAPFCENCMRKYASEADDE